LSLSDRLIARTTGLRAPSILLSNESLVFVTQASALFVGSGSLSISETVDLAILSGQPMTENKKLFSGLLSSGYERCFFDDLVRLGGLTASVPCEDSYSIFGESDGLSGFLVSSDGNREFNTSSDGWAVPAAWFHTQ
jgi:hypothetical protein